jgi:hypothetical protein
VGLILALVPWPARAELGAIRACVESNAPRLSSVQKLVVQARDALGRVSESRAKLYWRRLPDGHQRLLVRMEAPDDLAGVALLVIGRSAERSSVHLYLPELDESDLGGRPVWVVEARPDAVSSYEPIVAFVDQRYCLPLLLEFFGMEDRPLRRMRVDPGQLVHAAQSWMPRQLVVEDLRDGSRLTVKVVSLEVDIPLAPSLLTVKALRQ